MFLGRARCRSTGKQSDEQSWIAHSHMALADYS
jgi:hypothetical protein